MDFTLTLVASSAPLTTEHIKDVQQNLTAQSISTAEQPDWLSENKAADIHIPTSLTINQIKSLRALLDSHKIDVFCTRTLGRRKKLLVADMDYTIVTTETLDE